jgi:hypothetical protein
LTFIPAANKSFFVFYWCHDEYFSCTGCMSSERFSLIWWSCTWIWWLYYSTFCKAYDLFTSILPVWIMNNYAVIPKVSKILNVWIPPSTHRVTSINELLG